MCLGGGGSPKVEAPKPAPLPPPMPAPAPPPKAVQKAPKQMAAPDAKPDIRIGGAKKSKTGSQRRSGTSGKATSTLSIGDNQGLSL